MLQPGVLEMKVEVCLTSDENLRMLFKCGPTTLVIAVYHQISVVISRTQISQAGVKQSAFAGE